MILRAISLVLVVAVDMLCEILARATAGGIARREAYKTKQARLLQQKHFGTNAGHYAFVPSLFQPGLGWFDAYLEAVAYNAMVKVLPQCVHCRSTCNFQALLEFPAGGVALSVDIGSCQSTQN